MNTAEQPVHGPARTEPVEETAPVEVSAPVDAIGRRAPLGLPCHESEADLWFAEAPAQLEQAKALCQPCPVRALCLAGALERHEPWGVWGGEILIDGRIVARKRPRGRPRKHPLPPDWSEPVPASA